MRYLIMVLGLSIFATSCSKGDVNGGSGSGDEDAAAATYMDLSYGTDAKQKLDLYLPESRSKSTRTVIIIHGGGWTAGDKADFAHYIDEFRKRLPDHAFANLNYRLATTTANHFPTQENDVKAAIQFLKENREKYVISGDFIFIGISAGAQLALLQGYKHTDIAQPLGMISYFGPTDLQRLYENSDSSIPTVLKTITNSTLETNPQIFLESSPINFVTPKSPPTLLLHGDKDRLVPLEQALVLRDKLKAEGVPGNLVIYPGQGHDGWTLDALQDSFQRVEDFIKGL